MTTALALPVPRTGARKLVAETGLLVERSLRTIPRVPERLLDVTLQPIVFTLLFALALLGDDRTIAATYSGGQKVHQRAFAK